MVELMENIFIYYLYIYIYIQAQKGNGDNVAVTENSDFGHVIKINGK